MIVVNFFYSKWASARGINGSIRPKAKTELDANLRLFYTEAWNKDGENYSCRSTLLGFRNGLDRYLNKPPYKKGIHIATDPAFQQSKDAKLKDIKKHGEQNVKHKPMPLSVKTSSVWKRAPLSLLYNVWFHVNHFNHFNSVDVDRNGKETWPSSVSFPPGWKQRMVLNHGPWWGKQNTPRPEGE